MTDRRKLTDRQRAEQVKAVAQRRVDRLKAERDKHQGALDHVIDELRAAEDRLIYVSADPALAGAGQTTVAETGTTEAGT